MSEKQPVNAAKVFLQQYLDRKTMRHLLLDIGSDASTVHGDELKRCETIMQDVLNTITNIKSPRQREVLMMRYINGFSWKRTIAAMQLKYDCSERLVYAYHGRGLQHVNEELDQRKAIIDAIMCDY